jgi:uncharacterized protein (TIGR03084 family)
MPESRDIRDDLTSEHAFLDQVVADLAVGDWHSPTPSVGWTVQDQIGHLSFFDDAAVLAITDPESFPEHVHELIEGASRDGADSFTLRNARAMTPSELLSTWRAGRERLHGAAASLGDDARVPWYGPSMSARSFLAARLMECWAHGVDVTDAVGAPRAVTTRLHHIARLGFITRGWSYSVRGLPVPTSTVRVELTGPDGEIWNFGNDDSDDTITGDAEAFCLVVTQRRHVNDTDLTAGEIGRDWLTKAQAFAGGPTDGPAPHARR